MSNISVIIVVLLSLLTLTLFVVGLRSRRKQALNRGLRHLDLSAFHTLMDRDDEAFLRERLSRTQFFHLKRLRIRVTWKYVRRIADNSAVVMRTTSMWRQDPDVNVAETASESADLAAQIRVICLVAFAKLAAEYAFPSLQLTPAVLAPKYESLRQNLSRLGSLHPQDLAPLASAI
jgi:hypothetical protein